MYKENYGIVPLTNLSKYLHYDTSATEVNINIGAKYDSEKLSDSTEPGIRLREFSLPLSWEQQVILCWQNEGML